MTEEQKRIVRQQIAGYALFDRMEREVERQMTVEDRLEAFKRIRSLAPRLPAHDSRTDDDEVMQTWMKIRNHYEALQQRTTS